jgi:hypothetical protein
VDGIFGSSIFRMLSWMAFLRRRYTCASPLVLRIHHVLVIFVDLIRLSMD